MKNLDDLKLRNEGYSKYGFNALASRNIGDLREIPDTRHKLYGRTFLHCDGKSDKKY